MIAKMSRWHNVKSKLTMAVVGLTLLVGTVSSSLAADAALEEELQASILDRPRTDYVWEDRPPARAISRKLYLNNCKPNGCSVTPGQTYSRNNTSTIPRRASTLSAFAYSDNTWQQVVTCVKETFSPFNIEIVSTDPGNVPHMEVMVAGLPGDLQLSTGIGGIAPFSCGYIEDSLSFAFANVYGGDVDEICATTAQEIAHTWGLEHLAKASDPMTYFGYNGRRRFDNAENNCGSDCVNGSYEGRTCTGANRQLRSCVCTGRATANSFAMIRSVFGSSTPVPPKVKFTTPRNNGDKVQVGSPVRVDVTSELTLKKAELRVDGTVTASLISQPYAFNLPAEITGGKHTIEVTAYDIFDLPGKASLEVNVVPACDSNSDCSETQACVAGRCVVGPGQPGGLGEVCTGMMPCASGQCASDGSPDMRCAEGCDAGADQCPAGFECLAQAGAARGLCWPNGESTEEGGGCNVGGNGSAPMLMLLGLVGLVVGRRRK